MELSTSCRPLLANIRNSKIPSYHTERRKSSHLWPKSSSTKSQERKISLSIIWMSILRFKEVIEKMKARIIWSHRSLRFLQSHIRCPTLDSWTARSHSRVPQQIPIKVARVQLKDKHPTRGNLVPGILAALGLKFHEKNCRPFKWCQILLLWWQPNNRTCTNKNQQRYHRNTSVIINLEIAVPRTSKMTLTTWKKDQSTPKNEIINKILRVKWFHQRPSSLQENTWPTKNFWMSTLRN